MLRTVTGPFRSLAARATGGGAAPGRARAHGTRTHGTCAKPSEEILPRASGHYLRRCRQYAGASFGFGPWAFSLWLPSLA
jgi:hypothetical protein